ncbi:MAG: type II methionyl aminopeptidase [Candidatus Lokiarchaeota archaeon]|nr:type II methionyl aminopeptidase [Candidatus Harpocratesius repetitus]
MEYELTSDIIEKYMKAGKAVAHALKLSYQIARPGTNMGDLAKVLEDDILAQGAEGLAFPANLGINHIAAHYSPVIKEQQVLPEHGLLKIDLGGHVDGYVADAAVTINLGNDRGIYSDLIKAAKDALYTAISLAKPGVNIRTIGAAIQVEIEKYKDLTPVSNLGGHRVSRWDLHGSPFIPNVGSGLENYILKEGDQIAIEPFSTNGYGAIRNGKEITIFEVKNIHKKKNLPQIERIRLKKFKEKFGAFPFSPRWVDFIPEEKVNDVILKYYRQGILQGYNVFVERAQGLVAQHEHTLLITKEGAIPTTWWEDFDYHKLWQ